MLKVNLDLRFTWIYGGVGSVFGTAPPLYLSHFHLLGPMRQSAKCKKRKKSRPSSSSSSRSYRDETESRPRQVRAAKRGHGSPGLGQRCVDARRDMQLTRRRRAQPAGRRILQVGAAGGRSCGRARGWGCSRAGAIGPTEVAAMAEVTVRIELVPSGARGGSGRARSAQTSRPRRGQLAAASCMEVGMGQE